MWIKLIPKHHHIIMILYETEFHFKLPDSYRDALVEIHEKPLCGWVFVNTDWTDYKITNYFSVHCHFFYQDE